MSSQSPTNSLGLFGLPASTSSQVQERPGGGDDDRNAGSAIPIVVEGPTLRHYPEESDLREFDRLSVLPTSTTFPRGRQSRRGTPTSSPKRASTIPPADALGRRSTESEPTPRHSKVTDRAAEAFRTFSAGKSDPGHASPPTRNSPRWPFAALPLHLTRSRQEPYYPEDPYSDNRPHRQQFRIKYYISHFARQTVRNFLLRLPSTYFTRVRRVFEGAKMSKSEIDKMIDERNEGAPFPQEWNSATVSPSVLKFHSAWEEFIDSVMKEWKTLNIVSALLTTGILTLFQIEDASNDPITRTTALISMICALMSLIYGCTFLLRFGTMRSMEKAVRWAEEMRHTTRGIFWNVFVLLATPAVWLGWSMIFFCIAILSFVWTTGTTGKPQPLTNQEAIAPRIVVTAVFVIGIVVFIAVIRTFRSWSTEHRHGRRRVLKEQIQSLNIMNTQEFKDIPNSHDTGV